MEEAESSLGQSYLAAGLALVLSTEVLFLLLCFLLVLAFEVVLVLAAGAGAAGVWAARMAPTLKREAKISLFIWFSFFCERFISASHNHLAAERKNQR